MVATLLKFDSRAEWLEARKVDYRVGGSDVAAILGVSRFAGPWDVYASKRLGIERQRSDEELATLTRGQEMEPVLVEHYRKTTGREVVATGDSAMYVRDWMAASLDGLVDPDGERGVLETKTDRDGDALWGPDGAEVYPDTPDMHLIIRADYMLQGLWYLAVTGGPWCDYVVEGPFFGRRTIRLWANPGLQARVVAKVEAWRQKHLVDGIEPDIDASDRCKQVAEHRYREAIEAHRESRRSIQATPEQERLILDYYAKDLAHKEAAEARALAGNRVRHAMKDTYALSLMDGGRIVNASNGLRMSGFEQGMELI